MNSPHEWKSDDPHVQIPEWAPLGRADMAPSALSRHVFIVGETGSGKTRSGVVPVLNALLRYPGQRRGIAPLSPSMLVIDPKNELATVVREARPDRTISLDHRPSSRRVWLYEGVDIATATSGEVLARLDSWIIAGKPVQHSGNSMFFEIADRRAREALMGVDLNVFASTGVAGVTAFWSALTDGLRAMQQIGPDENLLDHANYFRAHRRILSAMMSTERRAIVDLYVTLAGAFSVSAQVTSQMRDLAALADDTFTSVVGSCLNSFDAAIDRGLVSRVQTSPFLPPPDNERISVLKMLDDGWALTYAPSDRSRAATAIGRVLKGLFFEHSMRRNNMDRPFLYVCDEFQRFITNDAVSGEQSFLDRCRAYRVICVLATQSEASIRFALAADGDSSADSYAIDILLNNTGTKLFFRNTDVPTKERLKALLPEPYTTGQHIVDVRPPATLAVGECYYLLSDGSWGRSRVALANGDGATT